MTEGTAEVSRRGFLRAASAGAAATAAAGTATAAEDGGGGGGEPDFGGYLSDVGNYDGVEDLRGQSEVNVGVGVEANGGNFGFGPPVIHVDNGTTVVWEWTGEGGTHNVIAEDGTFDSGTAVAEAGTTFEHTFSEDGVYNYYCQPHKGLGMKGSVVVGTDYPTTGGGGDGGGGGGIQGLPDSAKTLGVATTFVMAATLGLGYFFIKYGGDYGE